MKVLSIHTLFTVFKQSNSCWLSTSFGNSNFPIGGYEKFILENTLEIPSQNLKTIALPKKFFNWVAMGANKKTSIFSGHSDFRKIFLKCPSF